MNKIPANGKIMSPGRKSGASSVLYIKALAAKRPFGPGRRRNLYLQLQRTIQAGIPMKTGLDKLAGFSFGRQKTELLAMAQVLHSGGSFELASASAPGLFPGPAPALLGAAEKTGMIPDTLASMTRNAELELNVRKRLSKAVIYPIILRLSSAFILPLPKLITCGIGGYLVAAMSTMAPFVGVAVLIAALAFASLDDRVNSFFRRIIRRLPVVSSAYRFKVLSSTLDTLGLALAAGLGVSESLKLAANASGDDEMASICATADSRIRQGDSFSASFCLDSRLPDDVAVAVSTGEKTGLLADALRESAIDLQTRYADRLWWLVKVASTLILAIIMLFAALSILSTFNSVLNLDGGGEFDDSIMNEIPGLFNQL